MNKQPVVLNKNNTTGNINLDNFYKNYHPVQSNYPMYQNEYESDKMDESLENSIADDLNHYLEVLNKDMVDNVKRNDQQNLSLSEGEVDFVGFGKEVPIGGNLIGEFDLKKRRVQDAIEQGEKLLDGNQYNGHENQDQELEEGEYYNGSEMQGIGAGLFDVI